MNIYGLFEWLINTRQTKNGKITFIRYDTMSRLKTLEFENALCAEYMKHLILRRASHLVRAYAECKHIIRLEDTEFINNWLGY